MGNSDIILRVPGDEFIETKRLKTKIMVTSKLDDYALAIFASLSVCIVSDYIMD